MLTDPTHQPASRTLALVIPALIMSIFGVLMIFSASSAITQRYDLSPLAFGLRQLAYLVIATVAYFVVAHINIKHLCSRCWYLLLLAMLLLLLVLIPGVGVEVNGARSWLDFGVARLQPIELTKIAFIIYIAGHLHQHLPIKSKVMQLLPLVVLIVLANVLIFRQPDYSGMLIVLLICGGTLFIAGLSWRITFLTSFFASVLLALVAYLTPHSRSRLMATLDPWGEQTGSAYQIVNAIIAIGRGGWFGTGLGNSVQKFHYLPEAHTDFLLAITIEELGVISFLGLMVFLVLLMWKIYRVANECRKRDNYFGYLCCWGVLWMIASQSVISIGVNIAVLPTTGIPIPFFSFGGSSLLANFTALGLVAACARANSTSHHPEYTGSGDVVCK